VGDAASAGGADVVVLSGGGDATSGGVVGRGVGVGEGVAVGDGAKACATCPSLAGQAQRSVASAARAATRTNDIQISAWFSRSELLSFGFSPVGAISDFIPSPRRDCIIDGEIIA
jgi:hypothetical protein